jgi:hypothetical protein
VVHPVHGAGTLERNITTKLGLQLTTVRFKDEVHEFVAGEKFLGVYPRPERSETEQIKNIVCLVRRVKELTAVRADEETIRAAYELLGDAIFDYSPDLAALARSWYESTR